jgi:hypothetical protein
MIRAILAILLIVSVVLGLPGTAIAHSVQTDYLVASNSEMDLEVTFSTGEAFENAPVKVYAPTQLSQPWLEGQTDAKGRFAFKPDRTLKGDWRVEVGMVNTGDHGDILTVPVGEHGIESQRISDNLPQQPNRPSGVRVAVVYGVLGMLLLVTRKRIGF